MSKYSYLNRVRVEVEQLKVGMYVGELDKPWEQSPFLFQGFTIEDELTLSKLRKECSHVFVDFKDEHEYENHLLETEQSAESDFAIDSSLSEELPKALKVIRESARELKLLMRKIQRGDNIQLSEIEILVENCLESLHRNNRALVILCNIKHKIFYAAEHPLRVAIFAMAFAKHLKMSEQQLAVMGASAMLHDVGKFAIPERVLNKTEALTKQEKLMLKRHPIQSYKMLDQVVGVTEAVKEVALSHHERVDGKGYPRNIPNERVSRFAKIVSIIDTYDAVTSDRPHKEGKSPSYAFKILNNYKGSKFDEFLVSEFIKWMGVMPVGSLVEMATGEVGIVLKNSKRQKLRPKVLLVTDERKKLGFEKVVDLSQMDLHASGRVYQVKSVLPNASFGINIEHYLDSQSFDSPKWLNPGT
ncbi:HD-GYP domain-containing protein [Aliikangiella marina]|uniref:HD-GYP domain-containing protein n=1 Tax=Aliikangiella marina TaxID=1712262 RepID=A0A545T2M3_9GAMM|nr:HD-GYP domain-containing protein [Aliikangiella marina]TQV71473.1 HD-GYP domain-containing protein [Aliikangiella marina]